MYYSNYEDYMRSILGYPSDMQDTYQMNYFDEDKNNNYMAVQDMRQIEDLYPDIFKAINPTIIDLCSKCNSPITKEILEDMVEEIYSKIENNEININISLINDSNITSNSERESENRSATLQNHASNSQMPQRSNYNRNVTQNTEQLKRSIEPQENRETRQRRPNNPLLRDLIKILLLNQLIDRQGRPNMPPPRPPFPGGPRPPMPPRPGYRGDFDDYLRF